MTIDVIEVLVNAMHFGRSPVGISHNGYSHMRNIRCKITFKSLVG